ncbi:MAG: DNA-binding transcriptional ArsR family regulator [Alphaproteobacteria bacterium]|jgi:ArsR family transcriptional regulator
MVDAENMPLKMTLEETADRLAALGNPTRLSVFRLLVKAGESGMPVGAIQSALAVPASTLSHHIRHLVSVGLVIQDREGTTLMCRTNYPSMQGVLEFLTSECCSLDPVGGHGANAH